MENKMIDGRKLAFARQQKLTEKVKGLNHKPSIVSILIGEDPPSVFYTKMKQEKAKEIGINFQIIKYPSSADFSEVSLTIIKLNQDSTIDGIMIQLPLPEEFIKGRTTDQLLQIIDPKKDVDGLTTKGLLPPATVRGIFSILQDEGVSIKDKFIAVLGNSVEVGQPLTKLLRKLGAFVTVCDINTPNTQEITKKADIIISATGVPNLVTGEMVKDGAVVIDVGYERVDGKVMGDVDFNTVYPKVSRITPVPGGVGPMTVISLMENAVDLIINHN